MGNTLPHPLTASAGLTVSPATQCDTGLWPTSQREIMERSDTERLCQDLLQSAGQGGHITTSLAFLMPGKSLLWKRGYVEKYLGQGFTQLVRDSPSLLVRDKWSCAMNWALSKHTGMWSCALSPEPISPSWAARHQIGFCKSLSSHLWLY